MYHASLTLTPIKHASTSDMLMFYLLGSSHHVRGNVHAAQNQTKVKGLHIISVRACVFVRVFVCLYVYMRTCVCSCFCVFARVVGKP